MSTIISSFKNNVGLDINLEIVDNSNRTKKTLFLFLHGFKAFRNWGFYPYLCEKVAENDIISVRFDFSLSAVVDGERLIYNSELFAQNTVSKEVQDVQDFLEALEKQEIPIDYNNWNGEIVLCGHSRGAAIAILTANLSPRIKKLVLLSPIATFDRYSDRQKDLWRRNGYVEFKLVHSQQKLRLNYSYLEDILLNADKFNLPKAIANVEQPILIIHGKQDLTVTPKEAYELAHSVKNKEKFRFLLLDKAGHGFNSAHPFDGTNQVLEKLIVEVVNFINEK
ncbi:MAG: alpha/beta hydrolase [Ignavibacteria bacterium]|nr:alpha/beta hydrolase [Ignavibacteria bacterium]